MVRNGDSVWYSGNTATYNDYPGVPGSSSGSVAGYGYVDTGDGKHWGTAYVAVDYYCDWSVNRGGVVVLRM